MGPVTAEQLQALGVAPQGSESLAAAVEAAASRWPPPRSADAQVSLWRGLQSLLLAARYPFEVHRLLFVMAYEGRAKEDGPPPAWVPTAEDIARSNLGRWMREKDVSDYRAFHWWSADRRLTFWGEVIDRLGIRLRQRHVHVMDPASDAVRPDWLFGATLNIAESCFLAESGKTAILFASETDATVRRWSYGDLRRLSDRVARGLDALGLPPDARIALYLPMTPESVAAYLGIVLSGRAVVGIADASAPPDLRKRLELASAAAVITIDAYVRDGKEQRVYAKVKEAEAPRTIVLPAAGKETIADLRPQDLPWTAFLGDAASYEPVERRPGDLTNVLFSSGTTKDPKAIPWTHTTPIKCAADAHLHHDVHPEDVLAWPTSFGWMMGPWLTYASLVNRAAMALFVGSPLSRAFGEFVREAGVTILGVVPKMVRAWRHERTMEGLAWSRVRLLSSTAETSDPEDMFYLMHLAGYKPIIEYCGGTEIGGGYVTGTVVQPASPGTFSTPALGLDFYLLDEEGQPADRGEVALVPPSFGLSTSLLNFDHTKEYFAGMPRGPNGEVLRRHGDQMERLGGGYYRHHGRVDDMINLNGVKTSSEEIRHVLRDPRVRDTKPIAVDVDGSGQHRLVVFAVPEDRALVDSKESREELRTLFARQIKEDLNPLLAQVHEVLLVPELPQAGPGKTVTAKELRKRYLQA